MDPRWQKLQARIENIFAPLLCGDVKSIEYKPQTAVPLLVTPSAYREYKPQKIS
jgi:hypothetical protein